MFPHPQCRKDGLVVRELPDETVIYDRQRHKAHCLNRAAALVWRHCDGQTTVAELAELLRHELSISSDPGVVWLALDRLGKAHLLERRESPPQEYSRRDLVRRLGLSALLLPMVFTVATPAAASHGSCRHLSETCGPGGPMACCPGCSCDPGLSVCVGGCLPV